MEYPTDFPTESRAAVAAEKLRAGREFDEIREKSPRMDYRVRHLLEAEIGRYILRQFLVFVLEACKLGHKGIWPVDRIAEAANKFLLRATVDAEDDKGQGVICPRWTDYSRSRIAPEIKRQFERSNEWRQYEDALLRVAEGQEAQASNEIAEADREGMIGQGLGPVQDAHLDLLQMILQKNTTTLEKWASRHKLGRTTIFDWKAQRSSGKSFKGKVSGEKSAYIEAAIEADAAELGLTIRTGSD